MAWGKAQWGKAQWGKATVGHVVAAPGTLEGYARGRDTATATLAGYAVGGTPVLDAGRWAIRILGGTGGTYIDHVPGEVTFERFRLGTFKFAVHNDHPAASQLTDGTRVLFLRQTEPVFWGCVIQVNKRYDETGAATAFVEVAGSSYTSYLNRRIAQPDAGQDRLSYTGYVDNSFKSLVARYFVPGTANADQAVTGWSNEANESAGPSATIWFNNQTLLPRMIAYGRCHSVDFEVVGDETDLVNPGFVFKTTYPRRGLDRSYNNADGNTPVILSRGRGLVGAVDYQRQVKSGNVAIVGGRGEGQYQTRVTRPAAGVPTGIDRIEAYVNASGGTTTAEWQQAGDEWLDRQNEAVESVEFDYVPTSLAAVPLEDFDEGDVITFYDDQFAIGPLNLRAQKITASWDENGVEKFKVILGYREEFYDDLDDVERAGGGGGSGGDLGSGGGYGGGGLNEDHGHSGGADGPTLPTSSIPDLFDATNPTTIQPDDAAAPGAATKAARRDHRHGIVADVPVAVGAALAEGVSTSFARADHVHTTANAFDATVPTTIQPDDVAATGAAATPARRDHLHGIVAAVPGSITPDTTAAEGTATSFARSDHAHGITCDVPVTVGAANAEGTSTSFARADHVHQKADCAAIVSASAPSPTSVGMIWLDIS